MANSQPTTLAECGFLADELEQVRSIVRERYADWRGLLLRVSSSCVKNQHAIEIHLDREVERFAAVLYARTITTVQTAALVLEVGLVSQSRILLRSAMETLFALAAISKEPAVVDRLIEGHLAEQKRAAQNARRWKSEELKQIVEAEGLSGHFERFIASNATGISVFDLAKKAELEDWYRSVYMVFSWPVHGAVADLNRHAVRESNGTLVAFRNEPEIEDQESTWMAAIELLLKATTALGVIFTNVEDALLSAHYADLHELAAKINLAER